MPYRSLLLFVLALTGGDRNAYVCRDGTLFGQPNEHTGLTDAQCQPRCSDCGGRPWAPRAYSAAEVASLRTWTLLDPPRSLRGNPYDGPAPPAPRAGEVCAFVRADGERAYRLRTFASADEAERHGARVTHTGSCGACSTLTDLAVYLGEPELGNPVRQCGIDHYGDTMGEHVQCLERLGFTRACAEIWYYNTVHTRDVCTGICLAMLHAPHHEASGALNACLQCDEDNSGPIFKAVAGRTRRNTGMASSICRPCSEVYPIDHDYE